MAELTIQSDIPVQFIAPNALAVPRGFCTTFHVEGHLPYKESCALVRLATWTDALHLDGKTPLAKRLAWQLRLKNPSTNQYGAVSGREAYPAARLLLEKGNNNHGTLTIKQGNRQDNYFSRYFKSEK